MPYDAAKAVTATFCWEIRHALMPLFGPDFPSMCIPREDVHRFGRMVIDPAIVKMATKKTSQYHAAELNSLLRMRNRNAIPPPPPWQTWPPKTPPALRIQPADEAARSGSSSVEYWNTYYTSPTSGPYKNAFTPVNTRRSSSSIAPISTPSAGRNGPAIMRASLLAKATDGQHDSSGDDDYDAFSPHSRQDAKSPKRKASSRKERTTTANQKGKATVASDSPSPPRRRRIEGPHHRQGGEVPLNPKEMKAAHALLSLSTSEHSEDDDVSRENIDVPLSASATSPLRRDYGTRLHETAANGELKRRRASS